MNHPGRVLVQRLTLKHEVGVGGVLLRGVYQREQLVSLSLEKVGVALLADLALELLPVEAGYLVGRH